MAYDGTLKFDTSMDTKGFQDDANSLGNIVKGLGVFKIIEKGFQAITASMDAAVARYDTLNKFPRVLEQMGFSADEAEAATQKLSVGVQGLPTALDDVVSTAQRLTVLTGNLESSTDTTLALNDAFLASGSSAADASRGLTQYTQMLSSGKVDIMSWRTLQETMGYALQKTAETFGFAGEAAQRDLYDALRDGDITFKEFNARIVELDQAVGGFAEVAKTSTGGISTAFANLRTRTAAGMAEIISSIDKGFSQTRFKSIENIISTAGTNIKKALTTLAGAFGFLASKADLLVPAIVAVTSAFIAYKATLVISTLVSALSAGFGLLEAAMLAMPAIMNIVTAAQNLLNAAMLANPAVLLAAAIAALVGAITALIFWVNRGSEAYREHKKEVDGLVDAQEELTAAVEESESAYQDTSAEIVATSKVAKDLIGRLKDMSKSTELSEEESRKMAATVDQLNASIDGLNIAYDEETGAIKNINTGQELSISQLEDLVDAKTELAQANAWQERANELVGEQVAIQEELALIEAKKQKILEDTTLDIGEQQRLIKKLDKSADEYADQMEDVELRIDVVNENLRLSSTETADALVTDYERRNQVVESTGETIEQVAEKWNVSVDDILAAMERDNINLTQWVDEQEAAYEEWSDAWETNKTDVINGLKELPTEMEYSLDEMIEVMNENAEKYAEWKDKLVAVSSKLSPEALAYIEELGPGTSDILDEIIEDTSGTKAQELNDAFAAVGESAAKGLESQTPVIEGVAEQFMRGVSSGIASEDTLSEDMGNTGTEAAGALDSALKSEKTDILDSAKDIADGVVDKLRAMILAAAISANQMMAGILVAMNNKAPELYSKAREIANRIAGTMETALDVHSPSRVMINIFENVMMGIYQGMDGMKGKLYREAEEIAGGITERLSISPSDAGTTVGRLQAMAASLGTKSAVQQLSVAGVGGGGISYSTNLVQNITTPKPLSASEMTREGEDFLRRSKWQLL